MWNFSFICRLLFKMYSSENYLLIHFHHIFFFTLRNLRPCLSMNQKLLKIKAWNFSNSHLKMNQDEMDQKMSDYDWLKNKWTKKVTRIIKSNIWTYSNNWKRKHTAKKTTLWMGHRCILQKMPNKTLPTWKNAVFIQL